MTTHCATLALPAGMSENDPVWQQMQQLKEGILVRKHQAMLRWHHCGEPASGEIQKEKPTLGKFTQNVKQQQAHW